MEPTLVRALWHQLETVNAVTYFSAECREAPARLGLKGFWMGYFAGRAAPMGPVASGVVEAAFFNFHPERVRRAIPAAWAIATPDELLAVRASATAAALRRLLPDGTAEQLADRVLPPALVAIDRGTAAGMPLFAANRDIAQPADPVAALWQAATTLREHRGDVHVALLTGAGMDGCEAHVLFAGCEGVSPDLYQQSRGWSIDDWRAAVDRLRARGLVAADGSATTGGREVRGELERRTDELAAQPYAHLGDEGVEQVIEYMRAATDRIAASDEIPYPNPMGLPRPSTPT